MCYYYYGAVVAGSVLYGANDFNGIVCVGLVFCMGQMILMVLSVEASGVPCRASVLYGANDLNGIVCGG